MNSVSTSLWIGHLVVAAWGIWVLVRRADGLAPNTRKRYLTIGSIVVLLCLVPGVFLSAFVFGLVASGVMGMVGWGFQVGVVLGTAFGLVTFAGLVYIAAKLTRAGFARTVETS